MVNQGRRALSDLRRNGVHGEILEHNRFSETIQSAVDPILCSPTYYLSLPLVLDDSYEMMMLAPSMTSSQADAMNGTRRVRDVPSLLFNHGLRAVCTTTTACEANHGNAGG